MNFMTFQHRLFGLNVPRDFFDFTNSQNKMRSFSENIDPRCWSNNCYARHQHLIQVISEDGCPSSAESVFVQCEKTTRNHKRNICADVEGDASNDVDNPAAEELLSRIVSIIYDGNEDGPESSKTRRAIDASEELTVQVRIHGSQQRRIYWSDLKQRLLLFKNKSSLPRRNHFVSELKRQLRELATENSRLRKSLQLQLSKSYAIERSRKSRKYETGEYYRCTCDGFLNDNK